MPKTRKCPVCGEEMLDEYPNEICRNCKWEQDWYQEMFPDEEDQANKMSLNQARKAYQKGEPII